MKTASKNTSEETLNCSEDAFCRRPLDGCLYAYMRFRSLKIDLFCIYFMRNLKKDGSKCSIVIYPNHNSFSQLYTRKTQ